MDMSGPHFPTIISDPDFGSAPYVNGDRPFMERSFSLSSLSTLERNHEQLWDNLTEFYSKNEDTIQRSMSVDLTSDGAEDRAKDVQAAMDTFVETANVVLDGLVALGNVHPVLGIAIFAFHGVIKLDLTRRDNNRKVLAVKMQMQNMMCAMFQLRTLRHVHVQDSARDMERQRLQELIKVIADEITKCGSDLNYYLNRKLVSKLVNAKGYERRFAEHVENFAQRRAELQMTISSYIAAGVDSANVAIAEVSAQVTAVDHKLDDIVAMFRKFDTSRERDCLAFIEANGGAEHCIATDDLLTKLLSKAADSAENTGEQRKSLREALMDARKNLSRELSEDLQKVLANNQSRFEKLLNVQNNNLKRISDQLEEQGNNMHDHNMRLDQLMSTSIMILEEGKVIKKAITPNAPIKLKDPELQQIWDRMGLKRSVKAKQFVLTFRDYLMTDGHSAPNTPLPPVTAKLHPEPASLLLSASPTLHVDNTLVAPKIDEETELWVLKHIDVAHVQPIVEAMDEDGSGFISVKEANKFALSRPKGWSLLDWIAYWAAGWHYNITDYRRKIYTTLQKMHEMIPSLRAVNRKLAYMYLGNFNIERIEAILRSTRPLPSDAPRDPKLAEIANSMATLQEQRLQANLKEMSYLIQTAADVTLIAGTERVETWVLPLLHLVLERHLDIFKLAQTKVLHPDELSDHSTSLSLILSAFQTRIVRLKEIFRQVYRDSEAQFENFAYGMFHASHNYKDQPIENTILSFGDPITNDEEDASAKELDISILTKGLGPSLEVEDPDISGADPPPDHVAHPIEGYWVGCLYEGEGASNPVIYINIAPVIDKGQIAAKGIEFINMIAITGSLEDGESPEEHTKIDFKAVFDCYLDRRIKGIYNHQRDTIQGRWVVENEEGEFPSDDAGCSYRNGTFLMTRSPPHAFRFRSLLERPKSKKDEPDTPSQIARRRWAFALKAVNFQVQEQLSPWKFIRARIAERRTWVELSIRDMLPSFLKVTRGFMSPEATEEWTRLKAELHPFTVVFYEAVTKYLFNRYWYTLGMFSCDACRQRIAFTRYLCITCVEEDLHNQIDFCAEVQCTESLTMFDTRDFVHNISHTLLRANRRILPAEMPKLIAQSTLRSERIKRSFREREAREANPQDSAIRLAGRYRLKKAEEHTENELEGKLPLTTLVCATCKKDLTLPCWACAVCTLDTLFCEECESQQSRVLTDSSDTEKHSANHLLLRLYDSAEAKQIRLRSSNKQLEDMEARINDGIMDGLFTLEEKMNEQLEHVKSIVENVAKEMGEERAIMSPFLQTYHNAEPLAGKPWEKALKDDDSSTLVMTRETPKPEPLSEDRMVALESKLETRLVSLESKVEDILTMMRAVLAVAHAGRSES